MERTYLFWDIDGTLLTTRGAGLRAWQQAIGDVLGITDGLAGVRTSGMTDAEIALGLCRDANAAAPARLLQAYERALPQYLGSPGGHVMPNVREGLEALSARDDVVNMLLTGNLAATARLKLEHHGLWRFFAAGGTFSVEGVDRSGIACQARALAAEHAGEEPLGDQMVVIGDTPHDVACGKSIGARTLAVATGSGYTLAELDAVAPWRALSQLPDPAELQALLGLGRERGRGAIPSPPGASRAPRDPSLP